MPAKKSNDVDVYQRGYDDALKADDGQRMTTRGGNDPGVPKPGDQIGAYNKGYYDGAGVTAPVQRGQLKLGLPKKAPK